METQTYLYSPVAPFCLEINRTDDFDWTLTIPTSDQEAPIDGDAVMVYNAILAIRSEWGYTPNPVRMDTTSSRESLPQEDKLWPTWDKDWGEESTA
jgi:hypothetical protein